MEGDLQAAFARITTLEGQITRILLDMENQKWQRHQDVFLQRTVEEAAENVIVAQFAPSGIDRHKLKGLTTQRKKAGRRSSWEQRQEFELDQARLWLLCLLRQLSAHSLEQLRINYPGWVNTRTFTESARFINELYSNPAHPELSRWKNLLEQTRLECHKLQISAERVEEELTYVTLS